MKLNYKVILIETIILILGLVIFAFFNPISEVMSCNSDSICKIENNFIGGISHRKNILIKPSTRFDIKEKENPHFRRYGASYTDYSYYIVIDYCRSIFIKPYMTSRYKIQTNSEIQNFELYKKNPSLGYRINSSTTPEQAWLFVIIWTILMGTIIFQTIYESLNKKKWKPAKIKKVK